MSETGKHPAQEPDDNAIVGNKIRTLRKMRGISLQQMSKKTGMSYSYLSGLENGKHSISITNLQRVARFFHVNMIYFLTPSSGGSILYRKQDLDEQEANEGITYRVISPEDSKHLQVSYVHMDPDEPSERIIHRHGRGQEMILTLEGSLHVMVEEEEFTLGAGDSVLFRSEAEHLMFTEEEGAYFVIISSPPYGQDISSD